MQHCTVYGRSVKRWEAHRGKRRAGCVCARVRTSLGHPYVTTSSLWKACMHHVAWSRGMGGWNELNTVTLEVQSTAVLVTPR